MAIIGLNATCFNDRPSGARQRFVGLYRELIRSRPQDRFLVYEPSDCAASKWFEAPNVEARSTPIPSAGATQRIIAARGRWKQWVARDGVDLFEQFHLPLPYGLPCPALLTVHDFRDRARSWLPGKLSTTLTQSSLDRATAVLTVSETMRAEAAARTSRLVYAVHNGLAHLNLFVPTSKAAPILLAVGHLEPRKNYPCLIEAMALIATSNPDLRLVIVGRDSGAGDALVRAIANTGLTSRVTILEDVEDSDLRDLYRKARLFVFPSNLEGFGIPLLEAMDNGTPIIASDIPIFHEIAADAAAYFNPASARDLADTITRLLADEVEQERLAALGRVRVMNFQYATLAPQLSAIYDRLLGHTKGQG